MSRIGIDYTAAVRQRAGIGRYTRGLVRALAEVDQRREYVLFSAGREDGPWTWPANFARRTVPLSDRHLAILWQRLRVPIPVEWVTGKLDLFHSPDFVLPPVHRARTVLTIHDLSFLRHPECFAPDFLRYLEKAVPRSIERADLILADSQSTAEDLVELLAVPPARIAVLYPGLEARFRLDGCKVPVEPIAQRYGVRRPYILGLGTIQPRKNFCRLIEAYHRLREEKGIPHQLVIGGGRGWLDDEVDETIAALGLEQAVRLIGFVADQDLPALYQGADVLAFPSLYEGFGLPVLEAMGCGTPVVTSTASSLPEVAGEAALLVEPKDVEGLTEAIWRTLDDSGLRETLRQRGAEQASKFSWEHSAQELVIHYAELIGK